MMIVVFLLFLSATQNESARILSHNKEKKADEHVLLSSQKWRQTKPSALSDGTGKNSNEAA